jgi:hypothetical protein
MGSNLMGSSGIAGIAGIASMVIGGGSVDV